MGILPHPLLMQMVQMNWTERQIKVDVGDLMQMKATGGE